MWEQALFEPGQKHDRELQPLGVVQRHEAHLRAAVERVGIRHQRRVVQEFQHSFAALDSLGRGVHQLLQILQARLGFRAVLLLESMAWYPLRLLE